MNDNLAHSSLKILIVEDDEDIGETLKLRLELDHALDAHVVEDGVEALRTLLQGIKAGQSYAVIVMDCAMPFMDGFTTVRAVRCLEKNGVLPFRTKIGMYTGYSKLLEPSTLVEKSDIDGIVLKTDPKTLIEMIQSLVESK